MSTISKITDLLAVLLEECGRVHAISDGIPNKGKPVEDHGGLIGVLEEDLAGDIEEDCEADDACQDNCDLSSKPKLLELLSERVADHLLKQSHCHCDTVLRCGRSSCGMGVVVKSLSSRMESE